MILDEEVIKLVKEHFDEYTGYCYSLGECFEQIIIWNRHNAQRYTERTEND